MKTKLMDDMDTAEATAAAFAQPAGGEMVPYSGTSVTASDGIITAQKVAVARDEAKVREKIRQRAAWAGDDWGYRFPVTSKGGKKDFIEGPSIKCANNVAQIFGNCQIDTRVVDNGDSWIIYARFVDYETGFSYARPFQQRKNQNAMKTDADRARDIALQIGVSKAIRNVICNALELFTTFAHEEARKNIVDKVGKNLGGFRDKVLARLRELKVDPKRVEAVRGRPAKDWLAPDVALTIAELQSIQDGMATIDETWPQEAPPAPTRADVRKEMEQGASAQKAPVAPPQPQEKAKEDDPATVNVTLGGTWFHIMGVTPHGEQEELYSTEDPAEFARLLLAEAKRVGDLLTLNGMWELNSSQFDHLPKEIGKALRDGWPRLPKHPFEP